jgi:competence protein ComEC
MRTWTLAFFCGVIWLQCLRDLPALSWCPVILILVCLSGFAAKKIWRYLRLPAACACGFVWCLFYAHWQSAWTIPEDWQGKDLQVRGYIASIPHSAETGSSFLFSVRKINYGNKDYPLHALVKLSWRNDEIHLHAGEEWDLAVHLKKPYGTMNPGGFDYEAYAFQEGIRANGYVVDKFNNHFMSSHWYRYTLNRLREIIASRIAANLPASETSPWITALVIGEHSNIDVSSWEVLRKTGTNHLMAIAGLHIGLMAALAHLLVAFVWRRIPRLTQRIPAVYAGATGALLMAFLYSALAGFSLPARRASLMLSVFLSGLLLRRKMSIGTSWCLALLCVLVLNPLVVLTESFWLSFGSVALIIYGVSGRLSPRGLWWKWGRIQWVIALGLIPLTLALFQQCSLIAFAANSVSIPIIGFIVVPLSLFGSSLLFIYARGGADVLWLTDKILALIWRVLKWFSHLPDVVWYQSVPNLWMLVAAIFGIMFLLMPRGLPGRWLGIIWVLPVILYKPAQPATGSAWLTLLDVGQGLSAVVQTQNHLLVFDTGARLSGSYDMGESVLVPFLHTLQVKAVDMLVISHGDNDHSGGAKALLASFSVNAIRTSVPAILPGAEYCLSGETWEWDGVHFSFIYPDKTQLGQGNNSSCVLLVTSGRQKILFTGDIEKPAEKVLLKAATDFSATILIAPHHGSKTSALKNFVTRVDPHYVLFATGFRNRYHFPHVSVVRTYRELGSMQLNTAQTGAIQFQLDTSLPPDLYRISRKHYWNN